MGERIGAELIRITRGDGRGRNEEPRPKRRRLVLATPVFISRTRVFSFAERAIRLHQRASCSNGVSAGPKQPSPRPAFQSSPRFVGATLQRGYVGVSLDSKGGGCTFNIPPCLILLGKGPPRCRHAACLPQLRHTEMQGGGTTWEPDEGFLGRVGGLSYPVPGARIAALEHGQLELVWRVGPGIEPPDVSGFLGWCENVLLRTLVSGPKIWSFSRGRGLASLPFRYPRMRCQSTPPPSLSISTSH